MRRMALCSWLLQTPPAACAMRRWSQHVWNPAILLPTLHELADGRAFLLLRDRSLVRRGSSEAVAHLFNRVPRSRRCSTCRDSSMPKELSAPSSSSSDDVGASLESSVKPTNREVSATLLVLHAHPIPAHSCSCYATILESYVKTWHPETYPAG